MVHNAANPDVRYLCIVEGCFNPQLHRDEVQRHVTKKHPRFNFALHWEDTIVISVASDAQFESIDLPLRVNHENCDGRDCAMDSAAGRGQREKKPSEKVKELIGKKIDTTAEDPNRKYPPVYTADHVKASADVKEVEKTYHHTKITTTGDKYDFYQLGSQ